MLLGPIFAREVITAPRRRQLFVARTLYGFGLSLLAATAWLVLTGTQTVSSITQLARFGGILFQILVALQLALAVFFSAVACASAVSQEKDRRTLVLLLMTHLSNSELVLGRLAASMLTVVVLLLASLPLFAVAMLFGGVGLAQVLRTFAVTLLSAVVAGSLGSTFAFWREKTFQTLALTGLCIVFWLIGCEILARGAAGDVVLGLPAETLAACASPWRAALDAANSTTAVVPALGPLQNPANAYLLLCAALAFILNTLTIARVRVWNPSRAARRDDPAESTATKNAATSKTPGASRARAVWDNPVVWREIVTWAYGRRILVIHLAYLLLFGVAAAALVAMIRQSPRLETLDAALVLSPLFVLSLVLVNAQAVTAITTERDGRALDLLLVTDLTPKEIVFGKLGGVFWNTKDVVLLPMLLCGYLWYENQLSLENLVYLIIGLAVMYLFVAVLGLHAGMSYLNSRHAIAVSLGTVFFLFVGIATCMRIMVSFSGSFQVQLQPFLAFMVGGSVGLYFALGARNPSTAIFVASLLCPIATFYAMTSFLLQFTLAVVLVTTFTYGFATAAMLVPAIYEFDVVTGRTTADE